MWKHLPRQWGTTPQRSEEVRYSKRDSGTIGGDVTEQCDVTVVGTRRASGTSKNGWIRQQHLSGRARDNFPEFLAVGDALSDFQRKLWRMVLRHLPDAGPKLVEEIHPRVIANRRTKIVERC